jgi:hypothetical protein
MHRLFSFAAGLLLTCLISACQTSSRISLSSELHFLTRKDWGAALPVLQMQRHTPAYITIHHTATAQAPERPLAQKLRDLQAFSVREDSLANGQLKQAWPDIPYHFYIASDGRIGEGRELKYMGDSNTSYNLEGHVLIVLEGNFQQDQVAPAQYESLEKLTLALTKRWGINSNKISGHKDQASTACPGKALYALLPQLRLAVDEQLR